MVTSTSSRVGCSAALVETANGKSRIGAAEWAQTVTKRTNFLVIGPIASSAWLESTHGRKILRAVELRGEGLPLRIVSEEAWIHAIESG
jgi:hypothetical protein